MWAGAASVAVLIVLTFTILPSRSPTVDSADQTPAPSPLDPGAEMRPDLMRPMSDTVHPSEYVYLQFPKATLRGIGFVLEPQVEGSWDARYWLVSDASGGTDSEPSWQPVASGSGFAIEDIGIGGVGPDAVQIPDSAPPGEYRICTANAVNNFCAPIEVVASFGVHGAPATAFDCAATKTDPDSTQVTDIQALLICPPSGEGSPILLTSGEAAFSALLGALSLPDEKPHPIASCAVVKTPPTVVANTSNGDFFADLPTMGCGGPRTEVMNALDGESTGPHRAGALDPLTISLSFAHVGSGELTVPSGGQLNSQFVVDNNSGETVTDSACNFWNLRYGLISVKQPNAELIRS
jgi:hypothetical protein